MNVTTRRDFCKAGAIFGATLAIPAPSEARALETDILRLFRQHQRLVRDARTHETGKTGAAEDAEMETLFYQPADKLEKAILAIPCVSAADMAAKMLLAHCDTDFSCLRHDDPVWVEARKLTGLDEQHVA